MTKYFIPFILSAACILSACSTINNEPEGVTTPGEGDKLSLSVSASDIVVSNGLSSRSSDEGNITTFDVDDLVGVIVLDKDENLLVENVPYRYDGFNWSFAGDEDKQPYYDAAMSTYIVYYPYTETAGTCKSIESIARLPIFTYQTDQSTDGTYWQTDLMAWSSQGKALRSINAEMKHLHDSFTLNIKIKWTLVPLGEDKVLEYQALRETLKDFEIVYKIDDEDEEIVLLNDKIDQTYHDKDGSYRYLLPYQQKGSISWQYTYRNLTFRGNLENIPDVASGKRYKYYETVAMGDLPGGNMQISDFYCSVDTGEENKPKITGYVFPWDAWGTEEAERDFPGRHCIGLVVGVEHHENDISDYSQCGVGKTKCEGYAISLTELDNLKWATDGSTGASKHVGTVSYGSVELAEQDWNGFYNQRRIKQYALNPENKTEWVNFPAAYACEIYGKDCGLEAPDNSSGWFLPSRGMIDAVRYMKNIETAEKTYANMNELLTVRLDTIKDYIENGKDDVYNYGHSSININIIKGFASDETIYWSSNETHRGNTAPKKAFSSPGTANGYNGQLKTDASKVRAFLAF